MRMRWREWRQTRHLQTVLVEKVLAVIGGGMILCAFLLVNAAYGNEIESNRIVKQSGEEYLEREEYQFSDILLSEQDYVEQKFSPLRRGLDGIKIRLAINYSGLSDKILLRIELCQGDTILQKEDITDAQIENWRYYFFKVDEELTPGKEYSIRIRQLEGPFQEDAREFWISYTIFHAPEHIQENLPYYLDNGERVEQEFEVAYVYSLRDRRLVAGQILADGLLAAAIGAVLLIKRYLHLSGRAKRIAAGALFFSLPAAAFTAVEVIAGNLWTMEVLGIFKNLLIYYLIYLILSLAVRPQGILGGIYLTGCAVWGLVQYFVLLFRGRVFNFQDIFAWKTAATVAGQYRYEITYPVFLCLLGLLLLVCICAQVKTRVFTGRTRGVLLLGTMGVMGASAAIGGGFLVESYMIDLWNMENSNKKWGTALIFLSTLQYLTTEEPEDYSLARVRDILDKTEPDISQEPADIIPENIILIMNESFADLEYLAKIDADVELLPYLHGLKENVVKGWTYVPVFGAGTPNSEYEALTGNSLAFLVLGSMAYQTNVLEGEYGLVSTLKAQGYHTAALHPYEPENWNRTKAYTYMGFDEFLSEKNWGEMELLRWCASDQTSYDKVIELCEQTEGKCFAFLVTMQNHGGYAAEWENFQNTVALDYDSSYPQTEQYLSLLQESDRAWGELVEHFQNVEENTMIVMFGDHQPMIETEFYEELYGKPLSELTFEETQTRYVTPFVIWANYDLKEEFDVEMSTNYLGSYILRMAGLKLPAYNRLLLKLWEDFPVLCQRGVRDKEGRWYGWNRLPESYAEIIGEYKILQYNEVFDRKNRVDEIFTVY